MAPGPEHAAKEVRGPGRLVLASRESRRDRGIGSQPEVAVGMGADRDGRPATLAMCGHRLDGALDLAGHRDADHEQGARGDQACSGMSRLPWRAAPARGLRPSPSIRPAQPERGVVAVAATGQDDGIQRAAGQSAAPHARISGHASMPGSGSPRQLDLHAREDRVRCVLDPLRRSPRSCPCSSRSCIAVRPIASSSATRSEIPPATGLVSACAAPWPSMMTDAAAAPHAIAVAERVARPRRAQTAPQYASPAPIGSTTVAGAAGTRICSHLVADRPFGPSFTTTRAQPGVGQQPQCVLHVAGPVLLDLVAARHEDASRAAPGRAAPADRVRSRPR